MIKYKIPTKNEWRMNDTDNSDRCWWWLASLFMAFTLVLIAASCQQEVVRTGTAEEGLPATVRLEIVADAASQAQTRADENAIKDLHVLVYTKEGELIGKGYNDNSPTITVNTRSGSDYTIYAIANTGNPTLFDGGVALAEAQLKAMKTAALDSWDDLSTASHLMMVGCETEVEIRAGNSTLEGGITVIRMAAKVTLNIKTKEGSGITIKDYQVCSLPTQSYYVAGTTDASTTVTDGEKTTVDAAAVEKTFLMYENLKGVVSTITEQKDKGESNAPANATYVIINGEANGYKAIWRVYLGENNTSNFDVKRNDHHTYSITLSRPGAEGTDTRVDVVETFVGGNSNCYMVKPGNAVTIPVERANESFIELTGSILTNGTYYQLQSSTAWTASLVWESSVGLVSLSETTGIGPTGRFKVTAHTTDAEPNGGNAVVAIKNDEGEILWSWHIWVTSYDGSTRFTHDNGDRIVTLMDRALGATSTTPGELSTCGLFYQWGRKDPFPGNGQKNGDWLGRHFVYLIEVYNAFGQPYITPYITAPRGTCNLTVATRNPDTFIGCNFDLYDWFVAYSSIAQNDELWSGGNPNLAIAAPKSVFDPCPAGWRVPCAINNVNPYTKLGAGIKSNNGYDYPGIGGYFPFSGNLSRTDRSLSSVNIDSALYTAEAKTTKGMSFYYGSLNYVTPDFRAVGATMRCTLE